MDLNAEWSKYSSENTYGHPAWFLEGLGYDEVESEIVGTWRWGNIIHGVYRGPEGQLTGVSYMDTTGEAEGDADSMNVEFYPVREETVTVTKYVKV